MILVFKLQSAGNLSRERRDKVRIGGISAPVKKGESFAAHNLKSGVIVGMGNGDRQENVLETHFEFLTKSLFRA
jgi:hypothetical protein